MTKAEKAIKEASERVSAYKFDISKYPLWASTKVETKKEPRTIDNAKKKP